MIEQIMILIHGFAVLLFGVFLSVSFADMPFTKKNILTAFIFCAILSALQAILFFIFGEALIWKLYPVIIHLPLTLLLIFHFHKRTDTAIISVFTAYLFCQPAKWFGVLAYSISESKVVEYYTRIAVLIIVFAITLFFVSRLFSAILKQNALSIFIFATIPTVYYVFDYSTVIYTRIWLDNNRIAAEFMPFFLSIVFTVFTIVYYKENEKKNDAERNEQITRITVEQQAKELETIRRSEREIRMLRHDLRLFLSTLAVCVDTDDKSTARDLINSYTEQVDGTKPKRFCANDTINYVLSDFDSKCEAHNVKFAHLVIVDQIYTNEIMFSSILSNALDNALNAVTALPIEQRIVSLMLKASDGKLLLSVKNPVDQTPEFTNGLPKSKKEGHGYGTQSIRHLAQKLGGNCQFTVNDGLFITRVIIDNTENG